MEHPLYRDTNHACGAPGLDKADADEQGRLNFGQWGPEFLP